MAESLAVRHRPRRFSDVAGQRHVVAVLRAAAAKRHPPQQLLLAGPSGTGKTTLARIMAAALFCPNATDTGDACGTCPTCLDVTGPGGRHPDVIELDAASHGGIDQIRELGSSAHIAPMLAPWKLYIIDEAHGLTAAGGQAALRLIEEPPAHTLFALATTDPDKLPTALRGRCLPCEVLPPTRADLHHNLRRICEHEQWDIDDTVLNSLLDVADPALGVRGTVMLLEKLTGHLSPGATLDATQARELLGVADPTTFTALTQAICAADRPTALSATYTLLASVTEPVLRSQLTTWGRAQLRSAIAAGHDEGPALHWLTTLTDDTYRNGGIELAVATMASPHLSRGPHALEALIARAESAATALGNLSPTAPTGQAAPAAAAVPEPAVAAPAQPDPVTAPAPATPPAPAPSSNSASTDPNTEPHLPSAHPDTSTWPPVPASDPTLIQVTNLVGQGAVRAALILRRAHISSDGANTWNVQVSDADTVTAAKVDLPARLAQAGQVLGLTITCTLPH